MAEGVLLCHRHRHRHPPPSGTRHLAPGTSHLSLEPPCDPIANVPRVSKVLFLPVFVRLIIFFSIVLGLPTPSNGLTLPCPRSRRLLFASTSEITPGTLIPFRGCCRGHVFVL